MKFALGYNPTMDLFQSEPYLKYYDHSGIDEVFFSCIGTISGHDMTQIELSRRDVNIDDLKQKFIYHLGKFRDAGKKLCLLLNASCYGTMEASPEQDQYVDSILADLDKQDLFPKIVTLCSPYMARYIKQRYPEIEVRMSVLNCISSIPAMQMASDAFDSFYINQDLNRNVALVKQFHDWCAANGKKLCMVVNSGCIGNCPYKMNHGNHSSHCYERGHFNGYLPCTKIWSDVIKDETLAILQGNWIRPEDIHNYEGICDVAKLDTRLTSCLPRIADAYLSGRYDGSITDVISITRPTRVVLPNSKFPDDYFRGLSKCTKRCDTCTYCAGIRKLFD